MKSRQRPPITRTETPFKTDVASPGKYKFVCIICKKGFQKNLHLEDHYRSQHGAQKLQCEYCEKTFVTSRSLEKHRPLHTGIFPFHCNVTDDCNAGFNLRAQLEAHVNQVHQGRAYSCLNCNRVFYVEKDLVKHQERCSKIDKFE